MKTITRLFGAYVASLGLAIVGVQAQDVERPQADAARSEAQDQAKPKDRTGVVDVERTGQQADDQAKQGALFRADDLVGAKIRNAEGKDLGDVKEMVVNVTNGDIRYAVVSYGGFLGLGDKLFAVPLQALKLERNEDGDAFFVADIDQQRLENAQGFDDKNWPNFADRNFTSGVDATYGVQAGADRGSEQGQLYKLSTFEGVDVRGADNKELGEVEWVLVDPQARKVAFLALDLEDGAVAGVADDHLLAVPMDRLSLKTADDDTFLSLNLPADRLQGAPTIREEDFNSANSTEWRQKAEAHFRDAGAAARDAGRELRDATREGVNKAAGAAERGAPEVREETAPSNPE